MSKEIVILYEICNTSEADYIRELFCDYVYRFTPIDTSSFMNPDIFRDIEHLVVCFSTNTIAYEIIRNFCLVTKPKIIIALGDEGGQRETYNQLSTCSKLLLRQHNYYAKKANVRTIPLGYSPGMMKNFKGTILPSSKRSILLSFVGDLEKSDRMENLKLISEHWITPFIQNGITPEKMRDVYLSSVFVPNFRGYISLDCFRLYEASLCGCIPVVVGDKNELFKTFSYMEILPPWIFATSWQEAIEKCKKLFEDKNELDKRQLSVLHWWKWAVTRIQTLIRFTIENYQFYSQEGQDQFLIHFFKNKGFFVDIGANDGVKFSNTKLLEDIGWDGVCVEPIKETFEKLKQNRKCNCFNVAVSQKEGKVQFQRILGEAEMLSGMFHTYDERHVKRIEKEIEQHGGEKQIISVMSIPFSNLIERENIDYVSIDVEGAEMEVLQSINFSKHNITLLSVENNYNSEDIPNFLKQKGYTLHTIIGHDWFFVKNVK